MKTTSVRLSNHSKRGGGASASLLAIMLACVSPGSVLGEAYPGSVAAPELQEKMAELEAAGVEEVERFLAKSDAINGFSERLNFALELNRARFEDVSEPGDLGPETYGILELMAAAGSYSEAKLLARAVYWSDATAPSVPAELSEDPNDPTGNSRVTTKLFPKSSQMPSRSDERVGTSVWMSSATKNSIAMQGLPKRVIANSVPRWQR